MEAFFDATPAQIGIMEHPAKVKVAVCGRRWGKTVMMAIMLAVAALSWNNCTVWYVSPRYARSLKMMRIMKKCKPFMQLVAETHSQFPPRFQMKNGSEICFVSADSKDELRGEGLRLICVDEAAVLTKYLFYEVLMPMVMDTDGTIVAGSTFNGRNWFHDLAESGKVENDKIKTWVYPTSTGMRFSGSEKNVARLAHFKSITPPMVWQQECECEPLAVIDAVFMYVDQCLIDDQPLKGPEPGHRYVCAQDIGRIVDRSGVVVDDLDTGLTVFADSYPLGMPHAEQAKRTRHTAERWNGALVVLDTTGGASGGRAESNIRYYQEIIPSFMPITWTIDTKRNMVNELSLQFEQRKTRIPKAFTELVSQLKLYRYKFGETAIQPTFYGRPDDLTAAKIMTSWARKNKWTAGFGRSNLGAFVS